MVARRAFKLNAQDTLGLSDFSEFVLGTPCSNQDGKMTRTPCSNQDGKMTRQLETHIRVGGSSINEIYE